MFNCQGSSEIFRRSKVYKLSDVLFDRCRLLNLNLSFVLKQVQIEEQHAVLARFILTQ